MVPSRTTHTHQFLLSRGTYAFYPPCGTWQPCLVWPPRECNGRFFLSTARAGNDICVWYHEHTTDGPLSQLHVLKMIFPCGRVLVSSIFGYTRPRHQQHCLSYGRMLIFAPCLVFSWYRTCSCTCRTERTQRYVAISLRSFRIRMLGTVPLPYQVYQAYVPALRID